MSKNLSKKPSLKNILKKRQDNEKELEQMSSKEKSNDTVKFDLGESESSSSFAKANNKGKWQIGGKTVQALFNKKDKADKAAAGMPDGPPEVKRIFSFPLDGDDDLDDIRNVYTDFREIVRQDEEDNQELFRQYLSEIVHSVSFNLMTMVAIVLNFLSIYVDVILQGNNIKTGTILIQLVQNFTLALFLMEMLFKYMVMPETFLKSSLNILDMTMILTSFFLTNTEIATGVGQIVSVLRSVRLISSLKKLRNRWPSLGIVYETLKLTLGEIMMMLLLWFFLAIIFVTLGCEMFSENDFVEAHFRTFLDGIWTAFVFLTMDGWRMNFQSGFDFYEYSENSDLSERELIFTFWYVVNILLIILFSLVMNSMIVARVVTNLDNAMIEQDADPDKDMDAPEEKKPSQAEDNSAQNDNDGDDTPLVFMTNHPSYQKLKQKPLFKTGLGNMTIDRVEDVLMIANALERNLRDYTRIREKLARIMEEMQILNDPLTTNNEALRVLACTAAGQEIRNSSNLTGPLSYRQSQQIRQSMSKSIMARQPSVMRSRLGF